MQIHVNMFYSIFVTLFLFVGMKQFSHDFIVEIDHGEFQWSSIAVGMSLL